MNQMVKIYPAPRSGVFADLTTIGAGAVGFLTVGREASSLREIVDSPAWLSAGTVVAGLSVVVGVSAATTCAPAKNL